jgi:organic hydroperoxide reductase OsmC/OhrA
MTAKLEFFVTARRVDASGSVAACKDATLTLDTALAGRRDALNPAELLLAALAACMTHVGSTFSAQHHVPTRRESHAYLRSRSEVERRRRALPHDSRRPNDSDTVPGT